MNRIHSMLIGAALTLAAATVASAYDDLTPQEAYDAVVEEGAYILDVRTAAEYTWVGHPYIVDEKGIEITNIVNIPFKIENGSGGMMLNPAFQAEVDGIFGSAADVHIITMCRSGGRSAAAAKALESAGYTNVSNMVEGFEGDGKDKYGYRTDTMDGWKNSHLPGHTLI
ncbi:MAG: rhodanese-like domain-containing protein [Candidatus Electrothrix sp. AUS4]|nr:rhodanese-like domain-containing protein [Candidatus Electrothrix sp. AUS4]